MRRGSLPRLAETVFSHLTAFQPHFNGISTCTHPPLATIDDFNALDIRVGTVVEAAPFPEARKPAIRLVIDFGREIGRLQSSAQLTKHYEPAELVGRRVVAVVNFPPRRIVGYRSDVLVLGAMPAADDVILLEVERAVANGTRIG